MRLVRQVAGRGSTETELVRRRLYRAALDSGLLWIWRAELSPARSKRSRAFFAGVQGGWEDLRPPACPSEQPFSLHQLQQTRRRVVLLSSLITVVSTRRNA